MARKEARLSRRRAHRPAHKRNADTAQQIAATALRILESEGADAVTMHRVAREIGITPMAIYHHYRNRKALLQRIVDDEILKLVELGERLMASPRYGKSVEVFVDAYLDYAFERPHVFDYIFNMPRPDIRKYPQDFRARRSPSLNPVADRVAAMMVAGELRKDDVWEVSMQLWAHAHGYVTMYRAGRFDMDESAFRALYHRAVKRLFQGLAAPAR